MAAAAAAAACRRVMSHTLTPHQRISSAAMATATAGDKVGATSAATVAASDKYAHLVGASFYAATLWMHDRHPKTLALNARAVAEFGYLKDLPEILHRIIHGGVDTTGPRRYIVRSHDSESDRDDDNTEPEFEPDGKRHPLG
jgi:hypothetical protein